MKGIIFGQYGNEAAKEIDKKYEAAALHKENKKKTDLLKNPQNTRARELAAMAAH